MKIRTLLLSLLLLIQVPVFAAPKFRPAKERIPNRYLVVLADDVNSDEVNPLAHRLARMHGGQVIATMEHAIKAFGFRGSEQAARALSNNPNIAYVEEDAIGYLAVTRRSPRRARPC